MFPLLLTVFAGAALGAPAPPPKERPAPSPSVNPLPGTWQLVSMQNEGKEQYPPGTRLLIQFTTNSLSVLANGEKEDGVIYTLTPGKQPLWIDFTNIKTGARIVGILEVKGDLLRMCYAERNTRDRPTRFASEARSPSKNLMILRRLKP